MSIRDLPSLGIVRAAAAAVLARLAPAQRPVLAPVGDLGEGQGRLRVVGEAVGVAVGERHRVGAGHVCRRRRSGWETMAKTGRV